MIRLLSAIILPLVATMTACTHLPGGGSDVPLPIISYNPQAVIPQTIHGHFLEHIYDSVENGLDGQFVPNPTFQWHTADGDDRFTPLLGLYRWSPDGLEMHWSGWQAGASLLAVGDAPPGDYNFRARIRRNNEGWHGFIVALSLQSEEDYLRWRIEDVPSGGLAIERVVAGVPTLVGASIANVRIETGRTHEIEVIRRGSNYECRLDGAIVAVYTDPEALSGKVGIGTLRSSATIQSATLSTPDSTTTDLDFQELSRGTPESWQVVSGEWTIRTGAESETPAWMRGSSAGVLENRFSLPGKGPLDASFLLRGMGDVTISLIAEEREESFHISDLSADKWRRVSTRFGFMSSSPNAVLRVSVGQGGTAEIARAEIRRADSRWRAPLHREFAALRPAFIRWPGGCFSELYDWRDGVGPSWERPVVPNHFWGGFESNGLGTAEFLTLCRELQSEPVLVLNIGMHQPDRFLEEYLQKALDWIEYCNGGADTPMGALRASHGFPDPWNVRYWEIGNETWGMGTERYLRYLRRFSEEVRRRWPEVRLLACGSGAYDQEWNRAIISEAAETFDYLSIHHYAGGRYPEIVDDAWRKYPAFMDEITALLRDSANPSARIAMTEWNDMSVHLRGGIYAALLLNEFERRGRDVTFACPALLIRHVRESDWNNAFINHDRYQAFTSPAYRVSELYRRVHAPMFVKAPTVEGLNILASCEPEAPRFVLKVVNPSREDTITPDLRGLPLGSPTVWQMTGTTPGLANSFEQPDLLRFVEVEWEEPMTFPPLSVTVLEWSGGFRPLPRVAYSAGATDCR